MEDTGRLVFWEALYLLFTNPSLLYEKVAIQKSNLPAFFTYTAICGFVLLVSFTSNALFNLFIIPIPFLESTSFLLIQIAYFILSVALMYIYSLAVYLILRGLGGVAGFDETFRLVAYCTIPTILFSLVPGVGLIAGMLVSSVLLAFGLRFAHELSIIRTAFAVAVPIAIFVLLLILGLIPLYSLLAG